MVFPGASSDLTNSVGDNGGDDIARFLTSFSFFFLEKNMFYYTSDMQQL